MDIKNPSKKQIKKLKYADSILQGKSKTQAAIDAGYSPASAHCVGSNMSKDPEIKQIIAESMARFELGPDRYAKELDNGLKRQKIGSHVDYLDRLGALNGIKLKEDDSKPINQILILNDIKDSQQKGLAQ